MTIKLIAAPATEPVSRADAKLWCRIDAADTTEDALIDMLIASARIRAEHITGRSFLSQTWERVIDAFPEVELELGVPPVMSISQITYVDAAGAVQTLAPTAYVLDADQEPGWALPAQGNEWPVTLLDTANAVRVRFISGYADSSNKICAPLWQWMHMQIATAWQFRSQIVAGMTIAELPGRYVDRLLDPYRIWGV